MAAAPSEVDNVKLEAMKIENLAADKLKFKTDNFDVQYRALIDRSKKIIQTDRKAELNVGEEVPALKNLDKYFRYYDTQKSPAKHFSYLELLFNRNRSKILAGDDSWLLGAVIQFGEGLSISDKSKCAGVSIDLKDIYAYAKNVEKEALETIETKKNLNIPMVEINKEVGLNPVVCSIIQLHLYRIFYLLLEDSNDQGAIAKITTAMEDKLGVKPDKRFIGTESWKIKSVGGAMNSNDPMAQIFQMATGLMSEFGISVPTNMPAPSGELIVNGVRDLMNNQAGKQLFGQLAGVMKQGTQGDPNFANILNTTAQTASDPNFIQSMQDGLKNSSLVTSLQMGMNPPAAGAAGSDVMGADSQPTQAMSNTTSVPTMPDFATLGPQLNSLFQGLGQTNPGSGTPANMPDFSALGAQLAQSFGNLQPPAAAAAEQMSLPEIE